MARMPWRRRADADTVKAPAPSMVPLADVLAALAQGGQTGAQVAEPLPRPEDWFRAPFGPGMPLTPAPINTPRPDSGRAEPRAWDYPTSWNLQTGAQRLIPWATLRSAADAPLVRQCIEHRQKELTGLDWDITVSQGAIEEAVKGGQSKAEAVADLQKRLAPDITRLVEFWTAPDPENGLEFADWLWQLLEEQLVLDAVAVYPRLTYGGDLIALRGIDGSTIKPLLDEYGARPAAPAPAYQQVLHGFPRGEFTADAEDPSGLSADQLIYRRRAVRTWTPYGLSPVEHVLVDLDLFMKRHRWMREEYTEGVTPEMVLKNTGASQWQPSQLMDYERDFNDMMQSSEAARRRARILPPGIEPMQMHDAQERYKPDYDMHVIKLVCSHFGVPPSELGFSEVKGLGNAGFSEGQANINYRIGLFPDAKWWARLLTRISRVHLGAPAELEFKFLGIEEEDEKDADAIAEARVKSGRMTLNEDRDRLGLPRYEAPEANEPMVFTASGVTPVDGASEPAPAPVIMPPPAPGQGGQPETSPEGGGGDGKGGGGPAEDAAARDAEEIAKAELATFRRWARKHADPSRQFEFTADPGVLLKLAPDLADDPRALVKAGGLAPKGSWAGWEHDLAVADRYAPRLLKAMVKAVDPKALARDWVAETGAVTKAVRTPEPRVWVNARGTYAEISADIEPVLADLWAEASLIGDVAATAVLDDAPPDWGGWKPGQTEKARTRLGAKLKGVARKIKSRVKGIAKSRRDDLARLLGRARDQGWTASQLEAEVRHILDTAARQIALTETTAASSDATVSAYTAAGVRRVEWVTEQDGGVCAVCIENEGDGAVAVGEYFSSGDPFPPAHPRCRCHLWPAS